MNYAKLSLLLVVLLVPLLANADGTCLSCKKLNEVCDPLSNACGNNAICAKQTDSTYKCTAVPGNGGDCSITKACLDEYACDPTSKICVSLRYLGYGEACANDTQCTTGLTCISSACGTTTYPSCIADEQCKYNERCNNALTCAVPVADGTACKADGDCSFTSNCLNSVCTAFFSVANGGACADTTNCDISQNLVCIKKTCQNKNVITNTKCNSTADCGDFLSVCTCDGNSKPANGTCHPVIDPTVVSKSTFTDYFKCLQTNKCPQVDANIPASCAGGKCGRPLANANFNPCNSGSALFSNVHLTFFSALLLAAAMLLL
ncbi:hypothetical protein SAMD00019534_066340 [Acytostelium subglobosum LB1]|uniref:hypothetical protein n=1 Tax=Acytostelium subglobosum LB1 TaxID=1410327 RepID=UPI00064485C8|nr:hypothetical protein SAMD00019534_066340 [Acytostelium subglobosum LB1]GAM23459.1 hypothetical protein SAMD00019534_066340 [Acytostelium subglobosum LB1]|eukprot:XP_012753908.1 hypothetical protein SAMD00019534_066340 [Acytostelium subglobosum LB1]